MSSVLKKIVLPKGSEADVADHLRGKGIDESFIYPDKVTTDAVRREV